MGQHQVAGALTVAAALISAVVAPGRAEAQYGRDAVSSRVEALARRDAASATLVGVIESGRLAQGQQVARAYRLSPGTCYWFIGAGDANIHDLDLLVRLRGVVVARDQSSTRDVVVPGERPYCPAEAQQVQVRVVAYRGGGTYATAVYSRAAGAEGADAPSDVATLLDRAAVRYAPGMGQAAEPTVTRMAPGEDLTVEARLEGGMCYRFIAVGGEGVRDLGLQVYQGSSELAHDDATSSEAVASYCATATSSVRVRLRMLEGSGEIALAPYSGGRQHVVRRPAAAVYEVGGEEEDYLARQLRALHGRVGEGRRGASEVLRATLRTSQDQSFPLRLEAGHCYTIVAVGAPSVRDLDLYLVTPQGMEQDRDDGPENHAVIRTDPCPRWSGTFTVRARVHAGYGPIAIQAFGN